jgi:hypothetical protein
VPFAGEEALSVADAAANVIGLGRSVAYEDRAER